MVWSYWQSTLLSSILRFNSFSNSSGTIFVVYFLAFRGTNTNQSMKKRLLLTTVFLTLFFISSSVFSQYQEYIVGRLLDGKTQEPIAFASIRIKDRALGIISNTDGSFKIPLKYKEYGDVIEISSMGYQTKEVLIHDFSIYEINNVRLLPAILELEEAVVTARKKNMKRLSPRTIVQKAIDALFENYPTKPYSQVGYYRDYQLDKEEYVNLNEGILKVYDQGFRAIDSSTTKVSIYDYKENLDFRRDTLARRPYNYSFKGEAKIIDKGYLSSYGGNEFTILRVHNAIRNHSINSYSFVHRFDTDLLKEHVLTREDDSSIGGEALYSIRFERKLPVHSAYGRLYISKYDYSIFKMEYAVYDETKNNSTGLKDKNGSTKRTVFEVTTSYRKQKNTMFLNYISFNNVFRFWEAPKLTLDYVELNFHRMHLPKLNLNKYFNKRSFVLTFSELLNAESVKSLKQFSMNFKGKKVAFDSLLVSENKVMLYPKANTVKQIEMLGEIEFLNKNEGLNERILKVEANNLQDVNGNIIGEWTSKDYNQFREFFVQEVSQSAKLPSDSLFMIKAKPIFEDQPIAKPDNFDDYWMNTPLQKIKN